MSSDWIVMSVDEPTEGIVLEALREVVDAVDVRARLAAMPGSTAGRTALQDVEDEIAATGGAGAVEAFRAGQIGFMDIPRAVEHALHTVPNTELSWASIPEADAAGRRAVRECFSLAATV